MKFKSDVDVEAALAVSGNVEIGSSGQTTLNQTSTHFFMDMTSSTSYFRNTSTAGGGFIFRNSGIGDFEFDNEFAGSIKFNTSNSERMRIASAGNVGIGTTNPLTTLHAEGVVTIKGSGTGTSGSLAIQDNYTATDHLGNIGWNRSAGGPYLSYGLKQDGSADWKSTFGNFSGMRTYMKLDNDEMSLAWAPAQTTAVGTAVTGLLERFKFKLDSGSLQLNAYDGTNKTGTPTYLLGTDASGNIVKTNTIPGSAAGPYLPLAGGTLTGALTGTAATFAGNVTVKGNSLNIWGGNAALAGAIQANSANGGLYLAASGTNQNIRLVPTGTGFAQVTTSLDVTGAGTFGGTVTAPTFSGDLNGTINTVTTAVTKANATNDTTVATTAFVQNLIGTIPAGLVFQGTWNAATNTPTLTSGSGTTGNFYIVSTSGSTNLDGVTDWVTGDWAVFIEQGGTDAWEKIDNSSVLDGAGTGQTLPLWSGSGTSNTLTDSALTQQSDDGISILSASATTGQNASLSLYGYDTGTSSVKYGNLNIGTDGSFNIVTNDDYIVLNPTTYVKTEATHIMTQDVFMYRDRHIRFLDGPGDSWNDVLGLTATTDIVQFGAINSFNSNVGEVAFYSANTENMRLDIDGNLGIGTTSPGYKLDVESGNIRVSSSGSGVDAYTFYEESGGPTGATVGYDSVLNSLFLGTTANNNTDIAKRLIISRATGNVGIGTTSPDSKLHVVADNSTIATFESIGSNANSKTFIVQSGGDRVIFDIKESSGGAAADLAFELGNSEVMRLADTGNVGIGTTGPATKLEVNSGAAGASARFTGTGASSEIFLGTNGVQSAYTNMVFYTDSGNAQIWKAGSTYTSHGGVGSLNIYNSAGPIAFHPSGTANAMFIATNSNVGIGTTNPGAKLDVNGEIFASSNVQISATGAAGKYYIRRPSDGSASAFFGYNSNDNTDFGIYNGSGGGNVKFWSNNGVFQFNNVASSELMRITSGGNVGIGTTSPGEKLHVVGNAFLSSQSAYMASYNNTNSYHGSLVWAGLQLGNNGVNRIVAGRTGVGGSFQFWTNNTNNAADYSVTPDGTMAMSMLNNGNVGIGTTAPVSKLDIRGRTDINLGGEGLYFKAGGDTANNGRPLEFRSSSNNGSNGALHTINATSGNGAISLNTAGVSRIYMDRLGNVGIGTTAPDASLTIKTGSSAGLAKISSDGNGAAYSANGDVQFYTNNSVYAINFFSANKASNLMRITDGGNVGIGTTSPGAKLQVDGGIQMADDSDAAAAAKVGTMRYRTGTEYVEVDGVELVTNGDFATDTDWTKASGSTISGGSLNIVAAPYNANTRQALSLTNGTTYEIVINAIAVGSATDNTFQLGFGDSAGNPSNTTQHEFAVGTSVKTLIVTASATDATIIFRSRDAGTSNLSITNVSVMEVTSEDASYADMCMQTGSSTYEWVNIVRNTY